MKSRSSSEGSDLHKALSVPPTAYLDALWALKHDTDKFHF